MRKVSFLSLSILWIFLSFGIVASAADTGRDLHSLGPGRGQDGKGSRSRSLTTIFLSTGGSAGHMFDITTKREIRITAIDVNADPLGQQIDVNVYWRDGTSFGHEGSSTGWHLLDHGTGVAAGIDEPTHVDLPNAAKTFPPGTYGIYVAFTDWYCNKTNGGPATYENEDLTLVTNCSNGTPEFGPFFFPRIWNGTIYYEGGAPLADIKCNGGDVFVQIEPGTKVALDYDVYPGFGQGFPVDVWIVLDTPIGFFSYDGGGPYAGWNQGLANPLYTGPLVDLSGRALDFALPPGSYKAHGAIDTVANGRLDLSSLYSWDAVKFRVSPSPKYRYDDGTPDTLIGLNNGGDLCWMHRFDAVAGGETITEIHCIFGAKKDPGRAPRNGRPCTVFVWEDPNDDGNPNDAVLVASEPATVRNVDLDLYNIIPLSNPPTVSGVFFVGCVMTHGFYEPCAPMDTTTPYQGGRAFHCGTDTQGGFDPGNLMNNQYPPVEDRNYWCLRAGY